MAATGKKSGKTVVVALGGNAILQPGQVGTFEEQLFNIDGAMRRIAQLVEDGWRVVLTHGNGPQVGNLLIQNALAARTVAPMPMDVCGAMSQGQIGYMAAQTLANHLRKRKLEVPVVTIVTQVAVDPRDKAFASPSKPVGPFYSETEAKKMMLEEGLAMREDAGRGWRRVVPSPEPREIVELEAVRDLVDGGALVVCSGGGGVPVVRSRGALSGIDAVIDKDLAGALLARELGADALLILTDVPRAYVHYGTPEQTALDRVTASEMRAYAAAGHFKAGSMGPKVEACLRFVEAGGESVIASLTEVGPAMAGKAGTHIVPDAPAKKAPKRTPGAKAAGKAGKAAAPPKTAARKQPARRPRRDAGTNDGAPATGGADVIDITTGRRRGAAE
jgi:carbamate kinase